jgi:hypothetical protein
VKKLKNGTKSGIMINNNVHHIDEETISSTGLRPSHNPVTAQLATRTRIFEFPTLQDVFVMESDFYGNAMPAGTCFLVFNGRHGFIGEELHVETLRNISAAEIRERVRRNSAG